MDTQEVTDRFFTREAFFQHIKALKEERAKALGLTVEEWDKAMKEGRIEQPTDKTGSEDPITE